MKKLCLALVAAAVVAGTIVPASADTTVERDECAWGVKADPDGVNIAYPDEGAQYWLTQFTATPGLQLRISGTFPRGRYMSFHVYEGSAAVDALADVDIAPSSGANPFIRGADRNKAGRYEVRLVPGPRPAKAERNTLYAPSLNGEPNVAGVIIYRLYLPEDDIRGGVPLPRISLVNQDTDGGTVTSPIPPCRELVPSLSLGSPVNEVIRGASMPAGALTPGMPEREWGLSRSRPQTTVAGPASVRTGNAFFANFHNQYLNLLVPKNSAEVVAFRAKAPTFVRTRGSFRMRGGQLRYWSICTNDFPTTRYVACKADEQMKLDRNGSFTMVVSDPDHRPDNLRRTDNWLPAGPYADFFILYRHMLPDTGFRQAIQRAPDAAGAAKTMRAYYPDTRMCTTEQFEMNRCGLR